MAALQKIEALSAQNAQMTVITGRRRIGKTTLIKKSFTGIPFVYFFVGKKSETLLCSELTEIVRETLGEDLGSFSDFSRLLGAIMGIARHRNFTLVLDEFHLFRHPECMGRQQGEQQNQSGGLRLHLLENEEDF